MYCIRKRNINQLIKAMKKQEIIEILLQEEKRLWDDLLQCVHALGTDNPLTDLASARYGTIYKLLQTLKLK